MTDLSLFVPNDRILKLWSKFNLSTLSRMNVSLIPMIEMLRRNRVVGRIGTIGSFGSGACCHEVVMALYSPNSQVYCYDETDKYIPPYVNEYFKSEPNLSFQKYDFSKPLKKQFKLVFSIQTLEHIKDVESAIDQLGVTYT